ncbi:MAG: HEAT repeat domain-containing protein [Methanothrix sp.]|nr:MAG: HEAT repeat domain-containing protein [Methanothrix sp.]
MAAAQCLGNSKDFRAIDLLQKALNDYNSSVRSKAALSLGGIKSTIKII